MMILLSEEPNDLGGESARQGGADRMTTTQSS